MYECFLFSPGIVYFFLCEKLDEYHETAEDAYWSYCFDVLISLLDERRL